MPSACRGGSSAIAVIVACALLAGQMACVPEVVRWDEGTHAALAVGQGERLLIGRGDSLVAGAAWIPPDQPRAPICPGSLAAVRTSGDTAFAAWWAPRSDSTAGLLVARSNDAGRSWRAPVVADSTDRGRTGCRRAPPGVTVDSLDGYVHVVYFMVAPEGPGLFCTHSMEGGTMFHAPVPIVYGERVSVASVASWGDTVLVAYEDPNSSAPQVWLALSRTTGHIFEERTSVSSPAASASRPTVALHGNRIAVGWRETSRGGGTGRTVIRTGTIHR